MEFDKVIKGRRSVRRFSKKEVSLDDISKVIDIAHFSPSSGNVQNWSFIVVRDKVSDVADLCYSQGFVGKAPCLIVVCSRMKEIGKLYGERGSLYAVQNCALVAYTIMLKAYDLGIGSCWIGAFETSKVKELLGVPSNVEVHAIIALGYGKGVRSNRDMLETMVYFETWKNKKRDYGIWPLKKYIGGKLKRLNKR